MKLPVPVPSEVLLSAMVGLVEVLQQNPIARMVEPPSSDMDPPKVAVLVVMVPLEVVEIFRLLGTNDTSLP